MMGKNCPGRTTRKESSEANLSEKYVLRNDIELISLWSMFTGYGVEWADKKRYAWSPLFKFLIGKKLKVKKMTLLLQKPQQITVIAV